MKKILYAGAFTVTATLSMWYGCNKYDNTLTQEKNIKSNIEVFNTSTNNKITLKDIINNYDSKRASLEHKLATDKIAELDSIKKVSENIYQERSTSKISFFLSLISMLGAVVNVHDYLKKK
ncbi:MAG: hypothetical protein ACP5NV_02060 [Candidatus Woesearchaeota archaeon]